MLSEVTLLMGVAVVFDNELEGFRRDRYFARSWALLTRDKGWIKPVLLLSVALLVPVVGVLGVMGYALEWARLTAWGVNSAPKQRGVRIGECIKSGWRGFVVALVIGIVWGLVTGILGCVPAVGGLFSFVCTVVGVVLPIAVMAAALRAAIYQKIGAGLRVKTLWQMISHDSGGILRIVCMYVLGALLVGIVTGAVLLSSLLSAVPQVMDTVEAIGASSHVMSGDMQVRYAVQALAALISAMAPALLVLLVIALVASTILMLLCYTAVGLWMRQFNVGAWGRDEDPLPPYVGDPRDAQSWQPAPPAAGWQQPQPQQPQAQAQQQAQPQPQQQAQQVVTPAPVAQAAEAPAEVADAVASAESEAAPEPADPVAAGSEPGSEPEPAPEPEGTPSADAVETADDVTAGHVDVQESVELTPIAVAPIEGPATDATPAPQPSGEESADQAK